MYKSSMVRYRSWCGLNAIHRLGEEDYPVDDRLDSDWR